jgi:Mn-dependent DtxR family transcriptional regulator
VAWWHAAHIPEPTRLQVAMVARYTVNGHFNNLVGGLRTKGLVDYPSSGGVMLTDEGRKVARQPDGELTRDELIQRTLSVLRTSALQKIFTTIVEHGRAMSREELAAATNYTVNGHFNNMVGSLRSMGVIEYPSKGGVQLAEMFEALS